MKTKKRTTALISAILLSILCLGAANPFTSTSRKDTMNRLEALERQNADLRQQVADLNMKIEVLSQRINASCGASGQGAAFTSQDMALTAARTAVPGLDVVHLTPETTAPVRPKGRLIVTNSDNDQTVLIEQGAPLPGTSYVPLPDPETTLAGDGSGGQASSAPDTGAQTMAKTSSAPVPTADELSAFNAIKELKDQDKMDEAVPLMEDFLKHHPRSAHEDKVAFWLGNYQYGRAEYDKAIKSMKIVSTNHFENSEVASEALFTIGLCYLELSRTDEAGAAFRELKILYPFSEKAEKAEQMLSSCCP